MIQATSPDSTDKALKQLQQARPGRAKELRTLLGLEKDWDGQGGLSPTRQAVGVAARLLILANEVADLRLKDNVISPSPNGGLDIVWRTSVGTQLLIVVPSSGCDLRYVLSKPIAGAGYRDTARNLDDITQVTRLLREILG